MLPETLLAALAQEPTDDVAIRATADFAEEHNDAMRAELIRAQLALHPEPDSGIRRWWEQEHARTLRRREHSLLQLYEKGWTAESLGKVPARSLQVSHLRGHPDSFTLLKAAGYKFLERFVFGRRPVQWLRMCPNVTGGTGLERALRFARAIEVDLGRGGEHWAALLANGHPTALRSLTISRLSEDFAVRTLTSSCFPELKLFSCSLPERCTLAHRDAFAHLPATLRALHLTFSGLAAPILEALDVENLEELHLASLGEDVVELPALLRRAKQLRAFSLTIEEWPSGYADSRRALRDQLHPPIAAAIDGSIRALCDLPHIRRIALKGVALRQTHALTLASSNVLAKLLSLGVEIAPGELGTALASLFEARHCDGLLSLDVSIAGPMSALQRPHLELIAPTADSLPSLRDVRLAARPEDMVPWCEQRANLVRVEQSSGTEAEEYAAADVTTAYCSSTVLPLRLAELSIGAELTLSDVRRLKASYPNVVRRS